MSESHKPAYVALDAFELDRLAERIASKPEEWARRALAVLVAVRMGLVDVQTFTDTSVAVKRRDGDLVVVPLDPNRAPDEIASLLRYKGQPVAWRGVNAYLPSKLVKP